MEKERNPAGKALFQMQFAVLMLNCGRDEMANEALAKCEKILTELEAKLDEE